MDGPLQAMFCESVLAYGYKLPSNAEQLMGGRSWQSYSREDKLQCCERLTYAQPVDVLVEVLDPDISRVFEEEWKENIESHGASDGDDDTSLADSKEGIPSDVEDGKQSRPPNRKRTSGEQRAMDLRLVMNP